MLLRKKLLKTSNINLYSFYISLHWNNNGVFKDYKLIKWLAISVSGWLRWLQKMLKKFSPDRYLGRAQTQAFDIRIF